MLLFYIIIAIAILFIILPIIDWEKLWFFTLLEIVVIGFGIVIGGVIRSVNNPEIENYLEIKIKYNYIIKHDSIPFKLKEDLYSECSWFNQKLSDNKKYHDNVWIGFYYPEVSDTTMVSFDLSKIK